MMDDVYIGTILIWPSTHVPEGWVLCDGGLLPVNKNQTLFALLGAKYGGDGSTTFAVPDLRGQVIVGAGTVGAGTPAEKKYPLAFKGGKETADVTITANNLPAHTHPATLSGTVGAPKLQASSNATGNTYAPSATNKYLSASPSGPTGGQMWSSSLTSPVDLGGLTGGNLTGATVVVGNNTNPGASLRIPTQPPYTVLNFIIATQGRFPPKG
ncbi:MAG: tail fiber protein [Thiotrichaceae bacterium]|nr:tail fiber protein [Thiotrichaceae bacterium]